MQNRMDRAVIMGHYPQTRMALVKHGETEISPSMVLCAHFVQDWLSADSLQARNSGSHLGANRLLLYLFFARVRTPCVRCAQVIMVRVETLRVCEGKSKR